MADSAIAKTADAMAPPTVLVALVMPVAKPVRSAGAAAAAVAGRAATRAPDPSPATAMLISACQVWSWNGSHSA